MPLKGLLLLILFLPMNLTKKKVINFCNTPFNILDFVIFHIEIYFMLSRPWLMMLEESA